MPKGLDHFKDFFKAHTDKYIVIGGTACEEHFEKAGRQFRGIATKDIDMVLIVEAYNSDFINDFWKYIQEGEYEVKEKEEKNRKYFRFKKPQKDDYPKMIELFSKMPEIIEEKVGMNITPIPGDGNVTSLSAIIMNEYYYDYLKSHSNTNNNFCFASMDALIILKAKAHLDYKSRKNAGEKVNEDDMLKHKLDVFRLATLLTGIDQFEVPEEIKADLKIFMKSLIEDPVDFKDIDGSNGEELTKRVKNAFMLN